jgi:MEDS: MEthanogen/methylotroph, DcmR Sensory domain
MIRSLNRDSQSYFQSYKNYFVAIYLSFLAFPVGDLTLIASSQPIWMRLALQATLTCGASIAAIWGYVATKLYLYPEPMSLKRVLSSPFRPIFLLYATYLVPLALGIVVAWTDPSAISTGPTIQVTYVLEGITLPSASFGPLSLAIGVCLVSGFTIYPFAVLSRLRSKIKDKDVRGALRAFASAFSIIGTTLLFASALSSSGYSIQGPSDILSVILIIVAVRAFRKPTFLKSFLGVVPSLESSPTASHTDQIILLHGPGAEKFGPISKYITDGVSQHNRVIYFHQDDEAVIREGLSRQGIDVTKYTLKGSLRLPSLGSIYPNKGTFDDTPIELAHELLLEAKTLGNEGLSVILDYDDFAVRPLQRFVQHLTDPRWTRPDHSLHVLMAFDSTVFRGEEPSLAQLESKIRTLDLSESMDTLSRTVGLSHEQIAGRKLLLEFDPQSDYDRLFKSILAESASNFERTVVFTRKDSPVYSMAQRQPAAKIFVLTSRVSYPKVENNNLVLLPSYDTSLTLDALNKTIEAYSGSSFTIIFDSITHFVFTLGPERTYSLVRQALELMISDKITAIFVMNSKAHDQKIISTFENMFDLEILDMRGRGVPEIRKKVSAMN